MVLFLAGLSPDDDRHSSNIGPENQTTDHPGDGVAPVSSRPPVGARHDASEVTAAPTGEVDTGDGELGPLPADLVTPTAAVEQATGVVMVRLGVDATTAFTFLLEWAVRQSVDLADAARAVLDTVVPTSGAAPSGDIIAVHPAAGPAGHVSPVAAELLDLLAETLVLAGSPAVRAAVVRHVVGELYAMTTEMQSATDDDPFTATTSDEVRSLGRVLREAELHHTRMADTTAVEGIAPFSAPKQA